MTTQCVLLAFQHPGSPTPSVIPYRCFLSSRSLRQEHHCPRVQFLAGRLRPLRITCFCLVRHPDHRSSACFGSIARLGCTKPTRCILARYIALSHVFWWSLVSLLLLGPIKRQTSSSIIFATPLSPAENRLPAYAWTVRVTPASRSQLTIISLSPFRPASRLISRRDAHTQKPSLGPTHNGFELFRSSLSDSPELDVAALGLVIVHHITDIPSSLSLSVPGMMHGVFLS